MVVDDNALPVLWHSVSIGQQPSDLVLEDLEQEVRPQEKQLSEEAQTKGALVSPRTFLRLTLLAGSRLSCRLVCTEQRRFGETEEGKE